MYGRLHERKLREEDYLMSCEKTRIQLNAYIDDQAKRVNIDSAKKRAVLQHMDYEGFRQMVLGANIFPTKSLQLYKFSKGQRVQNKVNINGEEVGQKGQQIKVGIKSREQLQLLRQVQGRSQMQCSSFREFKKKFNSIYPLSGELSVDSGQILYKLVKNQDEDRIGKIFSMDCEGSILVKIVGVFEFIIRYLRENDGEGKVVGEVIYQVKFMETVLKLKNMREFNLSILSKKERNKICDFLKTAKDIIGADTQKQIEQNTQKKIESNIQKQKTIYRKEYIEGSEDIQVQRRQQLHIQRKVESQQGVRAQDQKIIDELIGIVMKK